MKALNTVKFTFPSRSVNEAFARSAVAAFAAQADPTLDELADIRTAVSEAVTNCIVHAYPDTIGTVSVTAAFCEGGVLRVVVADKGVGIEDVAEAMQPMYNHGRARAGGPRLCGDGELYGYGARALRARARHARHDDETSGRALMRRFVHSAAGARRCEGRGRHAACAM